jgi:hypothetical protein
VATLQLSFNNDEFQKASDIDASMQKLNLYELEINAISDAIRNRFDPSPFMPKIICVKCVKNNFDASPFMPKIIFGQIFIL